MEVKALERALAYSLEVDNATGYVVLKNAVERFLSAQPKAVPVAPKQKPSDQNTPQLPTFLEELNKRLDRQRGSGCPYCGCPDGVPHFCTGRPSTGIEYWLNQPTAMGVATNGQRTGDQGSSSSRSEVRSRGL